MTSSTHSVFPFSQSQVERVDVLGVGISALNLDSAIQEIEAASATADHLGYVTVTGVHGVIECQDDEALKEIHNHSFLSTPDGMPMVWMGKLAGKKSMDRVYGPEFMDLFFKRTEGKGIKHYFFGGADGVAQLLKEKLLEKYPKCEIVGTYTPPFRPLSEEEEQALAADFNETQPHCIWVGLSTPKQEKFMHGFLSKFPTLNEGWGHGATFFGVGAAFDFHTGRVKQAPYWIQRSGFEWLFRVCADPKRLWKRYAVSNSRFIWAILRSK